MKNPYESTTRTSLELLYHISREIAATLDLKAVLQRVLFLSMKNIGAFSGSIIALDENSNPLASTMINDKRIIEQPNEQLNVTLEKGLAGWVVYNKQAVLIPDTSIDDRWLHRPDDAQNTAGGKSAVSVPVQKECKFSPLNPFDHKCEMFAGAADAAWISNLDHSVLLDVKAVILDLSSANHLRDFLHEGVGRLFAGMAHMASNMPAHMTTHMSRHTSTHISAHMSTHMPAHISMHMTTHMSTHTSTHMQVRPSV